MESKPTQDCSKCLWHGVEVLGKMQCNKTGETVEPFEGKYPFAAECSFFEGIDGSTNVQPKNCPLCGRGPVITSSGDRTTIQCSKCDLVLGKRSHLTQAGVIKMWNRRV